MQHNKSAVRFIWVGDSSGQVPTFSSWFIHAFYFFARECINLTLIVSFESTKDILHWVCSWSFHIRFGDVSFLVILDKSFLDAQCVWKSVKTMLDSAFCYNAIALLREKYFFKELPFIQTQIKVLKTSWSLLLEIALLRFFQFVASFFIFFLSENGAICAIISCCFLYPTMNFNCYQNVKKYQFWHYVKYVYVLCCRDMYLS